MEVALAEWRHKATDALLITSIITYLPAIALLMAGKAPPSTDLVRIAMFTAYAVMAGSIVLRRIHYGIRAGLMLSAGYVMVFIGNIAVPQGPYLRALPVLLPLLAIVLFGPRVGRYTTVLSVAILLCAPLLHGASFLEGVLTMPKAAEYMPFAITMTQSAALTGALVALMFLFERFHQFLLDSLTEAKNEAAERRSAYRGLEREMAARRRLEREAARAGDEERCRLGHEIHDGVCQHLTGASLRAEALLRRLSRNEPLTEADLTALAAVIDDAIEEARAVAKGLCPLDAEPEALVTALRSLATRAWDASGIPCRLQTAGDMRVLDFVMAQHLYRIAQEAVNNAIRHAQASRIELSLRREDDALCLEVADDGLGFPGTRRTEGMGLRTMEYRAHLLEGDFAVTRAVSGGTLVSCRVPDINHATADGDPEGPKK